MSTDRVDIYRCRPPEELRVPILVGKLDIEDCIPMDSEVETEVTGPKGGIAGGPSVINAE